MSRDGLPEAPRTAIVTGAGSGIGRAIALRLAADGARVFSADIHREGAAETAGLIADRGGWGCSVEVDISDEGSLAALVETALDRTGRIDSVAANAGVMVEGDILSVSLDDWDRAMKINATGSFLTARAVLPSLIKSGGALVFTASTVALSGMRGVAAYSAAKGAVAALTRQLAADFAERGVRVNAVAPGAVRTPLSESQFRARARTPEEFDALLAQVIQRYPLSRWGKAEEIAALVSFLLGPESGWMTGQVIPVDGGLLELR